MWGGAGQRWLRAARAHRGRSEKPRVVSLVQSRCFALFQLGGLAVAAILFAWGAPAHHRAVENPPRLGLVRHGARWSRFPRCARQRLSRPARVVERNLCRRPSLAEEAAQTAQRGRLVPVSQARRAVDRRRRRPRNCPTGWVGSPSVEPLRCSAEEKVLLGEDDSLSRKVLICARLDRADIDPNRLKINRTTRARLGSGTENTCAGMPSWPRLVVRFPN